MDQRIFEQLDMLERGARVETRPRHVYDNSSAEFSACDAASAGHYEDAGYQPEYAPAYNDDFVDQPMVLDSFDEQLLRQPDYNSRHGQAELGRARLSLLPGTGPAPSHDDEHIPALPCVHRDRVSALRFDMSRFAFEPGQDAPSTSPPYGQQLPSSPAFNASRRHPAPLEPEQQSRQLSNNDLPTRLSQNSNYQSFNNNELEPARRDMHRSQMPPAEHLSHYHSQPEPPQRTGLIKSGPPVVQGISLVSTHALPDSFRAIFPYPLFNAVQSECFDTIYKTNNNFVLSAPTGSGKTAALELAICRLINGFASGTYKIVYQAPTKSLCSERQRDWQAKFGPLGLQCAELTGDTDNAQIRNVQHASIIITTPEKWDSVTRKWKDQQRLMQMVKLFLIDEVHILKEDRGATLEAVVSRMKSIGSDVRFVALSATVPNSQDIAIWLGKDPMNSHLPAVRERFSEDFRPVKLQKHVCGYQSSGNDFAFDKALNARLPDVIAKWSQRKPIMVFCFTRTSCVETAKFLASWWATKGPQERYWSSPRSRIVVMDKDLKDTISSGVAFHHAGLTIEERTAVEKAYLAGEINVICCTSTLAVGVNLPCHMAIIKNTVTYQSNGPGGCKEYSDLEIMQMLGRAGRPQFDDSAVAVIMTRLQRVEYYEKMITGQEVLESCLHRNLIDHLNAEIGLRTITSASSAKKWLTGTFLYVRLKDHPEHYKIEGDAPGRSLDERLENICNKGIALLEQTDLVLTTPKLQCTEFGDAMARYHLQFETMRLFLAMPSSAKVSEILSAVSQAAEFKEIRFRAGEKTAYKDLNKNGSIKFPIPVNLDVPAHKVSLIIQSVLGVVELPSEDYKHKTEYTTAKAIIFQHAHRLIRCIIDCQLYLDDAVTTRNALMLARSIGAQVWDDSPLHMKQLDSVGIVAVRKLVNAGITSIEELEATEPHRIEGALSRNPPYGTKLRDNAKTFPKLRVSLQMMGEPVIKKGEYVTMKVKAEIGFLNETVPVFFQKKPVYICLLAETSDGKKVHFARISAKKLNKGQDVLFSANLTSASQSVRAYVMCDEIAGTMRHANLKPGIPSIAFPPSKITEDTKGHSTAISNVSSTSRQQATATKHKHASGVGNDEFGDHEIDDADFVRAEAGGFVDIDDFEQSGNLPGQPKPKKRKTSHTAQTNDDWEPRQLSNGHWACNHPCKDKTACKHLCCREGLDKKPKAPKVKEAKKEAEPGPDRKQTQLNMSVSKTAMSQSQAPRSKEKTSAPTPSKPRDSKDLRSLDRLHNSIKTKTPIIPTLSQSRFNTESPPASKKGAPLRPSFPEAARSFEDEDTSDYGIDSLTSNDLTDVESFVNRRHASRMSPPKDGHRSHGADDKMLDAMDDTDAGSAGGGGNRRFDLSSCLDEDAGDQDNAWQNNDELDGYFSTNVPTTPRKARASTEGFKDSKSLFMSTSSDSAVRDLGLPDGIARNTRPVKDATSGARHFFAPSSIQQSRTRTPSRELREEAERLERALPVGAILTDITGAQQPTIEEKPATPDELEKWFNEEFGTELFNYVG